jgi:hypothetical protein
MDAAAHRSRRVHDALLVAFWFACNIGVLLLNKALLSSFGFGCPVFLTALHVRSPAAAHAARPAHRPR